MSEKYSEVRQMLEKFGNTPTYQTKELELRMEALATSIFLIKVRKQKPASLAQAVKLLPIDKKKKQMLVEICDEILEVLEIADYDSGDDDEKEDTLSELQANFFSILDAELAELEKAE